MPTQQEIRSVRSQQDLRNLNQQRQEQQRIQQLRQQQQQEIERKIQEQSNQETPDQRINRIVNEALRRGRVSGEFSNLPLEERRVINDLIKEAEDLGERNAIRSGIRQVETQLGQSLTVEQRQQLIPQILSGATRLEVQVPQQTSRNQIGFLSGVNQSTEVRSSQVQTRQFNPIVELAKQAEDRRLRNLQTNQLQPTITQVSKQVSLFDDPFPAITAVQREIKRIREKNIMGRDLTIAEKSFIIAAPAVSLSGALVSSISQLGSGAKDFFGNPRENLQILGQQIQNINVPRALSKLQEEGLPQVGLFFKQEPELASVEIAFAIYGPGAIGKAPDAVSFVGKGASNLGREFISGSARLGEGIAESGLFPTIRGRKGSTAISLSADTEFDVITGQVRKKRRSLDPNVQNFLDALEESKAVTTAGREADLREATRKLIANVQNDPARLRELRKLYQERGRTDIFDDIINQEVGPFFAKPKVIPKPKNTQITSTNSQDLSKAVGGPGISSSEFEGTGQYERTDLVSPRLPSESKALSIQSDIIRTSANQKTNVGVANTLFFIQNQPQTLGNANQTDQRNLQRQPEVLANPSRSGQSPRFVSGFGTGSASGSGSAQGNVPFLRNPSKTPTRTGSRGRTRDTDLPKLFWFKGAENAIVKERQEKLLKKAYDVYIGQGKKRFKLADDLPIGKALKKGADYVSKNIEATFEVIEDKGKKTKIKDIKYFPDDSFRPSLNPRLKNPLIFVEKEKFRLSSGNEIMQIKKAKKSKSRFF